MAITVATQKKRGPFTSSAPGCSVALKAAVQVVALTLKQLQPTEPSLRHDTNIRHGCRALIADAGEKQRSRRGPGRGMKGYPLVN